MSRHPPSPPSSSSQPYATPWSSSPAQNEARESARPQDHNLLPRQGYPSMHDASVSPSQGYSSPHALPPPSRRSTHPTHGYESSFPREPAPPPSGSVSNYQPFPARHASISSNPPPPMTQHAATMHMPAPNIAPSMPYDMSPYPPSRSEMLGGSQSSPQSRSYWENDFSGEEENTSDMKKRSPQASKPFAGNRGSHGKYPKKGSPTGSPSGSPISDQLPCGLCHKMWPCHVIEHWRGFCGERHWTQYQSVYNNDQSY